MELLRNTLFDCIFITIAIFVSSLYFGRFLYYTKLNKNKKIFNYEISKWVFVGKYMLYIIWFVSLILAYLWPVIDIWFLNKNIVNKDIIFVVDVSKSMSVQDIWFWTISRIDYAKKIITSFVTKNNSNNYSLYIFAGKDQNISPLTSDSNWFLGNMSSIWVNSITTWGTKIKDTIDDILSDYQSNKKNMNIILLSDWWDEWENEDVNNLEVPDNFKIFTVWIGTDKWGYITEWIDIYGNLKYKTYNWEYVVSNLNTSSLKDLAKKWRWDLLLWNNQNILDQIKLKLLNNNWISNDNDSTYIFIILSFICFWIWYIIEYKKKIWKN